MKGENNQILSSENQPQPKKQWVTPKMEIISKDVVQVGSIPSYLEAFITPFGGTGSGS